MIPKETVDKILDAIQIEEVVGDFVPLRKRGTNFTACCPFHNEKTPSFYVSPSKGVFKCFGCGKAGSAVSFVMEHENISYVEALKYIARKYHIEVVEKEETAEEIAARQKSESLLIVTDFAKKFFAQQLKTGEGQNLGLGYFKFRKLEDSTIEKFGLGWAPSGKNTFSKAARDAGYKEEFLIETGLSVKRDDGSLVDRFFERVMFPIHSASGRVIAFGGRTLSGEKTIAKYINSPESEIYKKSQTLYGISFAKNEIARQNKCLLVEGYLDVLSMHQLGVTNTVASSGTSLTVEQVRLIKKFTENVTIIYDGDPAGIHAAIRGVDIVLREGLNVKIVLLPQGDDPDSFAQKYTLAQVTDYIETHEQDFIAFKADLLLDEAGNDPLKRANLINDIADTVALIPDAVKRTVYTTECGRKFDIDEQVLLQRITATRTKMLQDEMRRRERERNRPVPTYEEPVYQTIPPDEPSSQPSPLVLNNPFLAPCERELLDFILNNGQEKLEFDSDSDFYTDPPVSVADFIDSNLSSDGEGFENDLYKKVYDLYFEYLDSGLSQPQIISKLLNSSEQDITKVTEDIITPKYILGGKEGEEFKKMPVPQLVNYVPRSILVYKVKKLDSKIREYSSELAKVPNDDTALQEEILRTINNMYSAKNILNEMLGRRFEKK